MSRDPHGQHAHHHAHLGERTSPLVDGELDHDARDRALAHAAECPDCLAALDAERRLKSLLASAPSPAVPDALTARLLAIADPGGPMPPRERPFPAGAQPLAAPPRGTRRPAAGRPAARAGSSRPGGRRLPVPRRAVALAGGALSVTGLAMVAAFVVGGTGVGPGLDRVRPPVAALTSEHAATAGGFGLGDPGAAVVAASVPGAGYSGSEPLDVLPVTALTALIPTTPTPTATPATPTPTATATSSSTPGSAPSALPVTSGSPATGR
ncbi:MAG TPA: hypothetical protein VFS29_00280 [Motilibacteraceae bacterium]|nr:hypothetical protein [Motilibacteraceae bacterium]